MPSALARVLLMMTAAAAPSLMGELLPAVTVPFTWNAGLSLASASREVSARGSSSVSKIKVCVVGLAGDFDFGDAPLPLGTAVIFTSTGIVSSLNLPAAMAAIAFVW